MIKADRLSVRQITEVNEKLNNLFNIQFCLVFWLWKRLEGEKLKRKKAKWQSENQGREKSLLSLIDSHSLCLCGWLPLLLVVFLLLRYFLSFFLSSSLISLHSSPPASHSSLLFHPQFYSYAFSPATQIYTFSSVLSTLSFSFLSNQPISLFPHTLPSRS